MLVAEEALGNELRGVRGRDKQETLVKKIKRVLPSRNTPPATVKGGEAQLGTHHLGVCDGEIVIIHGAPANSRVHLQATSSGKK